MEILRITYRSFVFCLHLDLFQNLVFAGENFHLDFGSIPRGKRLQSKKVFKTFEPILFGGCLKECILRRRCKAFTFNTLSLSCQLGISLTIEENVNVNYITSEPSQWPQAEALAGLCANHTCPAGTTCVALKNKLIHCQPSECGAPTYVYFANEQPSDFSIGVTFHYTCQSGYTMSGGPAQITCQSDRKWTARNFYCKATSCNAEGYTPGTVCYRKYSSFKPPGSARRTCESLGGQLAKLETSTKYNYIKSRLSYVHVDGSDSAQEGVWRYFDGSPITYNPWENGYGSKGNTKNCRYLGSSGFRDISCGDWYYFLCEIPSS